MSSPSLDKQQAEYQKWKGVVERDNNMNIPALRIAGMPKTHTRQLLEEYPHLKKNNKFVEDEEGNLIQVKNEGNVKEEYLQHIFKKEFGKATEVLVREIEKKNIIYTTKDDNRPEMFIYSDGIYIPEGKSEIEKQLRELVGDNFNSWIISQVVTKIKADTYIEPEIFFEDNHKNEIPLLNGILNIKTLELSPFTPKKIFFAKIPVNYVPAVNCEKIDKFLTDVLASEDDKNVLYELVGFGLVKDYFLEKAVMMVGNGRNGKGKTLDLIKRLVGAFNCASVPLSSIKSDSPFISNLRNKMFNMAGDLSSSDLKDTGMFKSLTGRDLISANRKYKNVIQFENYAKFIFACNELPRVYDYSDGFWERWALLEFPYKFVDLDVYDNLSDEEKKNCKIKNPNIISEITTDEEMSGFLNQALLGLQRLYKNNRFSYSKGTNEVKNRWIRKADSFMAFCMDCLEESYDSRISKSEVRKVYSKYCKKHKVSGVSDRSIKATLQEMFGVSEEYCTIFGTNKQENHWIGVKFKENFKKNGQL
jgi:P4 family phage/plasmid primase-like protien